MDARKSAGGRDEISVFPLKGKAYKIFFAKNNTPHKKIAGKNKINRWKIIQIKCH
jgi:hypothetical protein